MQPYQKDLAAAFSGFVQDAPGAVEKFLQHRGEQLPLIALLNRDASFSEQCLTMPEGLTGDLARMLAPLDNQPFGTERYVSATLLAGAMLVDIDPDAADEFTDAVMQRLKHDLSAAVRDLPAAIKGK